MLPLLLCCLLGIYHYDNWQVFPSLDEVRSISATGPEIYVAVPNGVCILDRSRYRLIRTLNAADGITGEVRLVAHNPARGDVYITTDDGTFRYIPATGLVERLTPPFKAVSSIGIADSGAFFETDAGAFSRSGKAVDFTAASELPTDLTWYGAKDTFNPRDFPFLTPYFVTDEQLVNHPIALVQPDRGGKRLFVAARDYGILVYNIRSGFSQAHIRFGPSSSIASSAHRSSRITLLDHRLWFLGGQTATSLDSLGNWNYFLTRPGDLSTGNFRLLLGNVTSIERDHGLASLAADSNGLLLGTEDGIYSLGTNDQLVQLLSLPRRVNGLLRVHDTIIFGTEQGLFISTGDSVREYTDPYGATDWGVFDITRTTDGTAYFAALGGIVSRTPDGRWFRYVPPGFDLKEPVRALAASGTRVFMLTPPIPSPLAPSPSPVITVLDTKDGSYTTIDASRGLPPVEITALYADSQFLWLASPGQLIRLDYSRELR